MRQLLPSCAEKSVHSFWMCPSIWVVEVAVPHRKFSGKLNTFPLIADTKQPSIPEPSSREKEAARAVFRERRVRGFGATANRRDSARLGIWRCPAGPAIQRGDPG